MSARQSRIALVAIWGLLVAFAILQAAIWFTTGGIPRRPAVLAQVIAAWLVMLALAAFATMRLGALSDLLRQKEEAHRDTLDEIEELRRALARVSQDQRLA